MSIYKGWKPEHAYRPAERSDAPKTPAETSPPVHLRKAQPAATLLPKTASWLATLPEHIRPMELVNQFARITNIFAATWHAPVECRRYFGELLIDKRGGRNGFPPEVIADLLRLRNYYATLHPSLEPMWHMPEEAKRR